MGIDQVAFGFDNFLKWHEATSLPGGRGRHRRRTDTQSVVSYDAPLMENASKTVKTRENRTFLLFFHFTSIAWFRMIVTTREQQMLRSPVNTGFRDKLAGSRNKLTGGLMATQRMTQTQLVRGLAEAGEVSNKQSRAILDHLSSLAISEVKKNGVFVLPGIGRLVRVDRKARMGRNPATGESIKIPAKKVVKFRVAKAAKDAIVPPKKK
jgi:DNA-binding protein HU-beta